MGNVGFASGEDAARLVSAVQQLMAFASSQQTEHPVVGPIVSLVEVTGDFTDPDTSKTSTVYAEGRVTWFDPNTGTFEDGGEVLVVGADGAAPAVGNPVIAQFAGAKFDMGVYVQGAGSGGGACDMETVSFTVTEPVSITHNLTLDCENEEIDGTITLNVSTKTIEITGCNLSITIT